MGRPGWLPRLPVSLASTSEIREVLRQEQAVWSADAALALRKVATTLRILEALVLRELMTRFGRTHLGFLWLVLEPLILTVMVMIGWTILYGTEQHGVLIVQMVLTGYSMLTLWRHMVTRFMHCFRQNAGLLFHRNVRPLDTILARFFLETIGTFVAFFVSYLFLYTWDSILPIHDVFLLISAWFLLAGFSFSVATIVAAFTELWEPAEKFVQPLMYITIPLTGTFSMLSWMPADYHYALLFSPMINTVEMFRAGLIGPSAQTYYHPEYVMLVTVFLTAFGLLLLRKAQSHIRME